MTTPEIQQDIAYQLSHPGDDTGYQIIAAAVVCSVASILAVSLRLYARRLTKSGLGKDDYMMLLALCFHLVFNTMVSLAVRYGLGKHLIYANDPYRLGVSVVSAEVLISLIIPAAETSVLLLYHRLFPQKKFRIWLWVVGSLVWSTKVAFIVVTLCQCFPISKVWAPLTPGYCLSYWENSEIAAVLNILTDLMVLLMPVPLVWRLNLERKQRLQLIFAFTIGSLTCISGVVRTVYTPGLGKFDTTWNVTGLIVTSIVECCLFIISGCMPTYVVLLTRWNQKPTNRHQLSHSKLTRQSEDCGKRSVPPNSMIGSEGMSTIEITTDINTTFEQRV